MTNGLRASIKRKHDLLDQLEKSPTEEKIQTYKKFKNKLTSLMRNVERQYYEDQLELYRNDMRKSWKVIKEIIGKNTTRDKSPPEFIINNISTNNPEIICNAFNDYFIDIGTQLANKITGSTHPLKYLNSIQSSIFIPPPYWNKKFQRLYIPSTTAPQGGMTYLHTFLRHVYTSI